LHGRAAIAPLGAGVGLAADDVDHCVNLGILDADHHGRLAAPQEAAGRGEARRAELCLEQGIDHIVRVLVLHNRDDQFHARPFPSCFGAIQPGAMATTRAECAAWLRGDGHITIGSIGARPVGCQTAVWADGIGSGTGSLGSQPVGWS
jgi:hypothetical protein